MQGDQQQIKQLRHFYNEKLHVKMELEREMKILNESPYPNSHKEIALLLAIIDLKTEVIQIDETINQLSGL